MIQTTEVLKEVFRRPKSENDKKPAEKPTGTAADDSKEASEREQARHHAPRAPAHRSGAAAARTCCACELKRGRRAVLALHCLVGSR